MSEFRKKPVVIEAMQFKGYNLKALLKWGVPGTLLPASYRGGRGDGLIIAAQEDGPNCEAVYADIGDWIIRGVKGEFYPVKPDIFAATYELVE